MSLLLLLACPGPDTGETGETATPNANRHLDAASLGDSMLLGAWEHDSQLVIVGGNLTNGGGDIYRWDGSTLCREDDVTEEPLWWVHSDGTNLVMVGEKGTVLINGERRDVDTEATLFGAWVDGDDLLVVGGTVTENTGEVWRWSGTEWEALVTDAPGLVFKVYGTHVIGDDVAWEYDGATLTEVSNSERLVTVHEDVVVGGAQGPVVQSWDGSAWVDQETTWLGQPMNGVHVADGTTWATGMFGVMAYNEGSGWQIPDFPLTSEHFHAVRPYGDEVWFVGGNFLNGGTYGTIGRHGGEERSLSLSGC